MNDDELHEGDTVEVRFTGEVHIDQLNARYVFTSEQRSFGVGRLPEGAIKVIRYAVPKVGDKITSVEQLDRLPENSVIVSDIGLSAQKVNGAWSMPQAAWRNGDTMGIRIDKHWNATVVYVGKTSDQDEL